jgi:hypothetical protein
MVALASEPIPGASQLPATFGLVTVLNIALPLLSVLFGAAITYWLNVRDRRRNYVENLFNEAIAATAAAEASIDYIAAAGKPTYMTDVDFQEFNRWLVTEGMKTWATNSVRANEALARVVPYLPELNAHLPFEPDSGHRGTNEAIVSLLRQARPRRR